jgi:hypothetical protein
MDRSSDTTTRPGVLWGWPRGRVSASSSTNKTHQRPALSQDGTFSWWGMQDSPGEAVQTQAARCSATQKISPTPTFRTGVVCTRDQLPDSAPFFPRGVGLAAVTHCRRPRPGDAILAEARSKGEMPAIHLPCHARQASLAAARALPKPGGDVRSARGMGQNARIPSVYRSAGGLELCWSASIVTGAALDGELITISKPGVT